MRKQKQLMCELQNCMMYRIYMYIYVHIFVRIIDVAFNACEDRSIEVFDPTKISVSFGRLGRLFLEHSPAGVESAGLLNHSCRIH